MKSIHLSLLLCIAPHVAQASYFAEASKDKSSEATSSTVQPSLQSFARIVKLNSLTKEQLIARAREDKHVIQGKLFINGTALEYVSPKEADYANQKISFSLADDCRKNKNIVDAQGNQATVKLGDILIGVSAQNKGLKCCGDAAKNVHGIWHRCWEDEHSYLGSYNFPRYIPLCWIETAQTGDILEFDFKNPNTAQIYSIELECKDRFPDRPFASVLQMLKARHAKYTRK